MEKGYWIASIEVFDEEAYQAYLQANAEPFRRFEARFLVRAGRFECPEGEARGRNIVIEFPSYQAALDCYHSPEYQRAKAFRTPVSDGNVLILEGYSGVQPGDGQ